jgi:tetracycline repressor-like protein
MRADRTKDLIRATAERLYAQHGVTAVSNRQIGEAAGQGNNTAVGYHFGTRADLVRPPRRPGDDRPGAVPARHRRRPHRADRPGRRRS